MAEIGAHVMNERLDKWAFLCLFSVLCLTAYETDTDNENKNTYVTVCISVSFAFSFLASVLHLGTPGLSAFFVGTVKGTTGPSAFFVGIVKGTTGLSAFFVGTVIEGLSSLILVALWGGALPIIMNPANNLAQMYVGKNQGDVADFQYTISDANLYFTSWGAGVCAVIILASYVRERLGGAGSGMSMGYTTNWYLLVVASLIVIFQSIRFKNQICSLEGGTEAGTCGRNTYSLVAGESTCDP
jgi:hypothetical protein